MKFFHTDEVYAHCDVPCGVYTTHQAGIAAETVEKMVEKLGETDESDLNSRVRMIQTKEEWAEICKRELLILWTDYFKEEHLEMFPNLHDTFWKATKLCSANKREISAESAKSLREAVEEIAEMFKKAEGKGASTYRQNWL